MEEQQTEKGIDRRNFIRVAGAGLTAARCGADAG